MKAIPASGLHLLVAWLLTSTLAHAAVQPTTMRIPKSTAWVGQRLPFFVELRAQGSFKGAASFSLPKIPRTVIVKVGNPVVSSEEIDDKTWFVQTHEFALFSQQSGTVEIPAFEVRFSSHRAGFVGPVVDLQPKVSATKVEIRRPPGSDDKTFLITTTSLDITETWNPRPGPTQQGAVFHRTIAQQAEQVTGMALAPPSTTVPDGLRVYLGQPEVSDRMERGDFTGKRSDTITYVMQQAGTWKLPAITYMWWDPEKEKFGFRTLPEVTFEVAASPSAATENQPAQSRGWPFAWVAGGLIVIGIVAWQYRTIRTWCQEIWQRWNPPDRVAARKLLHACRGNDAKAAGSAWTEWCTTQPAGFEREAELHTAVLDLQRCLFGPQEDTAWHGQNLEAAFRQHLAHRKTSSRDQTPVLPALNP